MPPRHVIQLATLELSKNVRSYYRLPQTSWHKVNINFNFGATIESKTQSLSPAWNNDVTFGKARAIVNLPHLIRNYVELGGWLATTLAG